MNRPTFSQTVDVLVKAYLNDTLQHRSCYACAVGNLVANGLQITMTKENLKWPGFPYPTNECGLPVGWGAAFSSDESGFSDIVKQTIDTYVLNVPAVKNQIKATGYKWQELARIEFAFESVDKRFDADDEIDYDVWMFDGLMAVVDVLADIHGVDLTFKEEAKKLFVKV